MGLKIAILGTRGIPNHYGGFEHIAGQLAWRLAQKDHSVTVYNSHRHPYREKSWNGVNIIHCFDPENIIGIPGQFIYDLNCILDARKRDYDLVLMLGYTSSSVWGFVYPPDAVIVTNMDGLEWQRTKYSRFVRSFLKYAERLAIRPDGYFISDSAVIKKYIDKKYGVNSRFIAYGAELQPANDVTVLREFQLEKHGYFLLMARMEPENNIESILDGYAQSVSHKKFVVIGDVRSRFGRRLVKKFKAHSRIIFAGAIFDDRKTQSLTAFCAMYFHGHSVGGTNPSLLGAMAARVPICAHDNAFNRSVLGSNAWYFHGKAEVAAWVAQAGHQDEQFIRNNYDTVCRDYDWNMIVDQYENYFMECCKRHKYTAPLYRIGDIKI